MSNDRISEYLTQFSQTRAQMVEQLRRVVVGQTEVIEQLMAAIFTRGHCLLVGVPGLAKTLMVSSIAQILDIRDYRVATYLVLATRGGLVKKTRLTEYDTNRQGGVIAIKLREDDEVVSALLVDEGDDILLISRHGMSLRFTATATVQARKPAPTATAGSDSRTAVRLARRHRLPVVRSVRKGAPWKAKRRTTAIPARTVYGLKRSQKVPVKSPLESSGTPWRRFARATPQMSGAP